MNTNEKLNHIYKLYSEKKYSEAFLLLQEILEKEPQNIYAKRYESLLKPYLNDKSSVGKIVTIKGKNLKCPHCVASISFSALNDEQKTKIREHNYENLSLKCPYCHTTFTLQKKSENSIIGIKIGEKIFYKNKNYRVVGSVNYVGNWYEDGYFGHLDYLEWILLGEDNSYLYFSEGYFYDDGEKNYEFEFSEKIVPDFDVNSINFSEKNIVTAKSLYGENSKVYTVGEKVELYSFSYSGKKYVLEKESAGRQSEAGIYETWSVSKNNAFEIFGKEISSFDKFKKKYYSISKYFLDILIVGPLFAVFIFFIGNNIFENRQEISLNDITEGKKYEILFTDESLIQTKEISSERFSKGGIKRKYEIIKGFSFSVLSEEDKEVIKKLQSSENTSDEIKKIFSEKIYKLK